MSCATLLGEAFQRSAVTRGLSAEFFQQRPGLLEVGGVKALGEPAIERRQQLIGFDALALLLPQARQAQGSAQLPGPGLLLPGDRQRLPEAGVGLGRSRGDLAQQQLALEPVRLGQQVAPPTGRERPPGLGQQAPPPRPPRPAAPPSRTSPSGRASSCPAATTCVRPWCISARPAAPAPCMAPAQPRQPCPYPA